MVPFPAPRRNALENLELLAAIENHPITNLIGGAQATDADIALIQAAYRDARRGNAVIEFTGRSIGPPCALSLACCHDPSGSPETGFKTGNPSLPGDRWRQSSRCRDCYIAAHPKPANNESYNNARGDSSSLMRRHHRTGVAHRRPRYCPAGAPESVLSDRIFHHPGAHRAADRRTGIRKPARDECSTRLARLLLLHDSKPFSYTVLGACHHREADINTSRPQNRDFANHYDRSRLGPLHTGVRMAPIRARG